MGCDSRLPIDTFHKYSNRLRQKQINSLPVHLQSYNDITNLLGTQQNPTFELLVNILYLNYVPLNMHFTWAFSVLFTAFAAFGAAAPSDPVAREVDTSEGDHLVKRPNFKIVYRNGVE